MKIKINFPIDEFKLELEEYIQEGRNLYNKFKLEEIKSSFEALEREYNFWSEEVQEFLKIRLSTVYENTFLTDFKSTTKFDATLKEDLSFEEIDVIKRRYVHLLADTKKKIDVLVLLKRKTKFMEVEEIYADLVIDSPTKQSEKMIKEIFISHSNLDAKYVEQLIDIIESIGVPSEKIFCSSFEGYAVRLGNDFLEDIRERLNNNTLVIFVLSENFYSSVVSLCEMGATWVKTNDHIPILIPPFDYKDVKGVIPTTNGMKINEKAKYNSLKTVIEEFLGLESINHSVWERKRDNSLKAIKVLLDSVASPMEAQKMTESKEKSDNFNLNYYENAGKIIKSKSEEEWPDDFEMQLDYIERHKSAVDKLKNHNPIDIDQDIFKKIRARGRKDWKDDFEMQLDYELRQVESLRRLNQQ